ncbi:MAG TPA: hypothetical protein PK110_14855 [Niabella sp.]|nr:hypothetical protein [Niabella sp.]
MDYQTKTLLRTAPGSVGETAKAYANSYSRINKIGTRDIREFTNAFMQVATYRVMAYQQIGVDDQNLLSPISETIFQPIYNFFNEIEEQMKAGVPLSEYKDNRPLFKVDLPTMTLYTMLLESNNKRLGFAAADDDFMTEALKVVYQETNAGCSYQTLFTETDFMEENMLKVKLFLFNIDRSLGFLIRNSR